MSSVFRLCDQLPPDINSQTLFGNDQPLELEVGSGKGLFIQTASAANPETNFLGIEVAKKYAELAATKLAAENRTNAIMAAGDALPVIENQIAANSLEAIHVYFPDPWWKKRHRKRRVVNEHTIAHYSRALRPGGRLHFWTDVLDYFEPTVELIAEFAPELGVPIPEEEAESTHDLDYRTHFERRSRKYNIPVYRVRYVKRV